MRSRPRLLVFAKPPVPGIAKTRLAADLGAQAAAQLATAFLRDTLRLCRSLPDHQVILASVGSLGEYGPADDALGREVAELEVWPQGDGDLGSRLEAGLRRALQTAPWAIAVGTDSPGLPLEHLRAAVRSLEHSDAVVGPTTDGGYYLLGMRRCPQGALADLPWSSERTCAATLERFYQLGLSPTVAPPVVDVDTADDLLAWRHAVARTGGRAPFSEQALRELGLWPAEARG